jgi:hypothetical protein
MLVGYSGGRECLVKIYFLTMQPASVNEDDHKSQAQNASTDLTMADLNDAQRVDEPIDAQRGDEPIEMDALFDGQIIRTAINQFALSASLMGTGWSQLGYLP